MMTSRAESIQKWMRIKKAQSPARANQKAGSELWLLVVLPIIAIPFENQYTILGFSIAKLTIGPLLLAVLVFRFSKLVSVLSHRIFLFGMAFLAWSAICEAFHPYADLELIYRMLQVFGFAALVAVVASDGHSLRRILFANAGVCAVISIYLIFNFYGIVSMDIDTVREAGRLRGVAFQDMSLTANLNILAYTAGMGAIVALPQFLSATKTLRRIFWAAVYVLCFVGCLVPLSRGAMVAVVASSGLVLSRNLSKSLKPRRIVLVIAVVALLYALTPVALTTRFTTMGLGKNPTGRADSRAAVTTATLESMPEYWTMGVGSGQYWTTWAARHGFLSNPVMGTGVLGPHNGFFAAWIYFGLPGLALLCLVCFFAARQCPKRSDTQWEASATFGLAILGLVWLVFTHNLYLKAFGVILGVIMASSWRKTDRAHAVDRARAVHFRPARLFRTYKMAESTDGTNATARLRVER